MLWKEGDGRRMKRKKHTFAGISPYRVRISITNASYVLRMSGIRIFGFGWGVHFGQDLVRGFLLLCWEECQIGLDRIRKWKMGVDWEGTWRRTGGREVKLDIR